VTIVTGIRNYVTWAPVTPYGHEFLNKNSYLHKKKKSKMQTLIVQPQNKEQFKAVESVLKVLKVNLIVEDQDTLLPYVIESTQKSIAEAQEGKLTPFTSVREMLDME